MNFKVHLLRTPKDGAKTTRAYVSLNAVDVVEAALKATAVMEDTIAGTTGDWWCISAVPAEEPRWAHQTGRCDANGM